MQQSRGRKAATAACAEQALNGKSASTSRRPDQLNGTSDLSETVLGSTSPSPESVAAATAAATDVTLLVDDAGSARAGGLIVVVAESSRGTADLIVECLENEDVTHVFGIPGEENIRLVEASLPLVHPVRADAARAGRIVHGRGLRSKLRGRASVCSATLGPGAINLLLGTADATTDSTPLIALSAQVGMNRSFKESHQGVDLVSMFAPVTKWSALVATPGAVPEMIRKAFSSPRPNGPAPCTWPSPRM